MKLRVTPIYGWGWFDSSTKAVDVPAPFNLEVEVIKGSESFAIALGRVNQADHTLSGLWLLLSQRHSPHDGYCNLWAFDAKPDVLETPELFRNKPCFDGFAATEVI